MRAQLVTTLFIVSLTACSSSDSGLNENDSDGSGMDSLGINSSEYCPTGALYDEADDSCYIDCDGLDDNQCDTLEEEVFGDFDEFVVDNYSGADAESMTENNTKAQYSVQSDLTLTTLENTEPENNAKFKEIWSGVNAILPRTKIIDAFSQYHVDSDGADGTLAYVTVDENQPGKWILAFDDADYFGSKEKEFIHTSIHEFGHIVFLGEDQLMTDVSGSCLFYGIDEGCSKEDSHINLFYQQFWADIFDEHTALQSEEAERAFYEKYMNRFVSEYSATNPVEDAAEVFTNFVLREKPSSSGTIVNQKILMMHNIQALVTLRNQIRGKLSITRAKNQKSMQ